MSLRNSLRYGGAGFLGYLFEYMILGDTFLASFLVGSSILHLYLYQKKDESRSLGYVFLAMFLAPMMLAYGGTFWILEELDQKFDLREKI